MAAREVRRCEGAFGSGALRPLPSSAEDTCSSGPRQMFGDVWEWTSSPYVALSGLPCSRPGPSASTMANSCATRSCCAAVRGTPGRPCPAATGISSALTSAGFSRAASGRGRLEVAAPTAGLSFSTRRPTPPNEFRDGRPRRIRQAEKGDSEQVLLRSRGFPALFEQISALRNITRRAPRPRS